MNTIGYSNVGEPIRGNPQMSVQYPYNNYNNLISATPYQNYMGITPQQNNLQNQFLKCKPVSSREEAVAFQIDLDGSLWVFPNIANGKIYTKQINNDGSATFNTYCYTEEKEQINFNQAEFVTREEFNKAIQTIMAAMPNKSEVRQY